MGKIVLLLFSHQTANEKQWQQCSPLVPCTAHEPPGRAFWFRLLHKIADRSPRMSLFQHIWRTPDPSSGLPRRSFDQMEEGGGGGGSNPTYFNHARYIDLT